MVGDRLISLLTLLLNPYSEDTTFTRDRFGQARYTAQHIGNFEQLPVPIFFSNYEKFCTVVAAGYALWR